MATSMRLEEISFAANRMLAVAVTDYSRRDWFPHKDPWPDQTIRDAHHLPCGNAGPTPHPLPGKLIQYCVRLAGATDVTMAIHLITTEVRSIAAPARFASSAHLMFSQKLSGSRLQWPGVQRHWFRACVASSRVPPCAATAMAHSAGRQSRASLPRSWENPDHPNPP